MKTKTKTKSNSQSKQLNNFEHFREFTRKLVNVPKEELKKKEIETQQEKEKVLN